MADIIRGIFGGSTPSSVPVVHVDADFADFVDAPSPTPLVASSASTGPPAARTSSPGITSYSDQMSAGWSNIRGRTSISDFYIELFLIPLLVVSVLLHLWGSSKNRAIAQHWMTTYRPLLEAEYSDVGYRKTKIPAHDLSTGGLFRENSKHMFLSYATGRQNVAFMDIKLQLLKRYNPLALVGEAGLGFFFESMPAPVEKLELTAYTFDGRETHFLGPIVDGSSDAAVNKKSSDSAYDGFVWAVVHKNNMKQLRDDRYDLSITSSKEHPRLPFWAMVMSESAEITEALLMPELVKAIEACGEDLEALIVTDMPEDAPKTLTDLVPKKRVSLSLRLSDDKERSQALVNCFLRMPDHLVSSAHFRPEVMRRVKTTREDTANRFRKIEDDAKAEERKTGADKAKKEERDRKLKSMKPDEQRKFLERERERDQKKRQGKRTIKA